jgi:hypothetical protein
MCSCQRSPETSAAAIAKRVNQWLKNPEGKSNHSRKKSYSGDDHRAGTRYDNDDYGHIIAKNTICIFFINTLSNRLMELEKKEYYHEIKSLKHFHDDIVLPQQWVSKTRILHFSQRYVFACAMWDFINLICFNPDWNHFIEVGDTVVTYCRHRDTHYAINSRTSAMLSSQIGGFAALIHIKSFASGGRGTFVNECKYRLKMTE